MSNATHEPVRFTFDGCGLNMAGRGRILSGARDHWDEPWFKEACALFTAAPALLQAAKAALAWMGGAFEGGHPSHLPQYEALRSAIAKAEPGV